MFQRLKTQRWFLKSSLCNTPTSPNAESATKSHNPTSKTDMPTPHVVSAKKSNSPTSPNVRYAPTSPSIAPAMKSETAISPNIAPARRSDTPASPNLAPTTKAQHHQTSWLTKNNCHDLPAYITKYYTCHTKWLSWLILVTHETSCTMGGKRCHPPNVTKYNACHNVMTDLCPIWNVICSVRPIRLLPVHDFQNWTVRSQSFFLLPQHILC